MVSVFLSLALICFEGSCYPALVGKDTPVGEFVLTQRLVRDSFYDGSVLQFKETDKEIYAVHRLWLGKPEQKRNERIKSNVIKQRTITSGCINVEDIVYQRLINCCQNEKIKIYP